MHFLYVIYLQCYVSILPTVCINNVLLHGILKLLANV